MKYSKINEIRFYMINSTLLSLSLGSILYTSPFLSRYDSLSFAKSHISNSFTSFIFNTNSLNLHIKSSAFTNFLDSTIRIHASNFYFNNTQFTSRPEILPQSNDNIICEDSIFTNCTSNGNGGAFDHYSSTSGTLKLLRTSFSHCKSGKYPSNGGCVYFVGLNSTIDSCCVSYCAASNQGHSFFVSLISPYNELTNENDTLFTLSKFIPFSKNQIHPNECHRSTIVYSSSPNEAKGSQSLYLSFGQIRISSLNSTSNSVVSQAASLMVHTMDSDAIIYHCTIERNIGPWIVYVYGRKGSAIEESNFIDNILNDDEKNGLVLYYKHTKINHCFISQLSGNVFVPIKPKKKVHLNQCVFRFDFHPNENIKLKNCVTSAKNFSTLNLAHLNTGFCEAQRDIMQNPIKDEDIEETLKSYFRNPKHSLNTTRIHIESHNENDENNKNFL